MPKKPTRPTDRLAEYRRKRSAERTPEPFSGGETETRARLFVVQKHAARNMHYDLRLEMAGALQSWAVPRGPSLDPQEKRLAVLVEEHPLEYADFEGLIPEGNYGAGAVIVWDRGRWTPIGDAQAGLESGKLLFDLEGYKLRGRWTLFRVKRNPKEWLLVKKPDAEANPEQPPGEQSIRSGLTVEQLRDGYDPGVDLARKLRRLGAPPGEPSFPSIEPMLARTREAPFSRRGWWFELKYDGYRLLAQRRGAAAALRYRRGSDVTALFPEIAGALRALPVEPFIVDGEVVVLDRAGRPSFQRLQRRVHLQRRADIQRATVELPAVFFVFDLLACAGFDLRTLPLSRRKQVLRELLPPQGPLRYSDHIEDRGEEMFEGVRQMRLEGIVAKRADSPYQSGRSEDWLKIRADRTGDFVIVGFSPPRRGRGSFGALHLAAYEQARLTYAGRVGSGFTARQLTELHDLLRGDLRDDPPCTGELPSEPGQRWVEPRHVGEVRYKEWTADGSLRHPVFLRLRQDKTPQECARESDADPLDDVPAPAAPVERSVSFTNLQKVFWPDEGYTKGQLIDYYRAISPWLLPYLADRPLVLTRYPDGIRGKNFFQKDAPSFIPDWVRTERMWSEHAEREIHYFICDDEETLLYLINLGSIPLHLWSSRVAALQSPDWCILDLDPKQAPFEHVIRLARATHQLCDELGWPSLVKTSGSTGLHVLLPLGGQCSYEQSRTFGELIARVLVGRHPDIATVTRSPRAREGKVYVDYLQNGHGRLLVAPFCVRPLPAAPVSAPLRWSEVRRGLELHKFNILSVPRRMQRLRDDPLLPVLTLRPDLPGVLERLARLLE